jgi:hypothetical protein
MSWTLGVRGTPGRAVVYKLLFGILKLMEIIPSPKVDERQQGEAVRNATLAYGICFLVDNAKAFAAV